MKKDDRSRDRALGMDRSITRRNFLNGLAIGTAAIACDPLFGAPGAAAPGKPSAPLATQDAPGYYPPLLTGMRGSHPGSFEAAHALRDGQPAPAPTDTGEEYDLIIVGGGISGLAAAHFYRARARSSRILILDNHDDFGGHAKRNEFDLDGRLNLMNGGTLEIDSPRPYSPVAAGLLETLGLDVAKLIKTTQHLGYYDRLGLQAGAFFDRETFGTDKLVVGTGKRMLAQAIAQAPLSEAARKQIIELETGRIDYMPGLSSDEKKQRLSRMSYQAFLRDVVHADPAVLKFYHAMTHGEWGVGTDAVSALDCWAFDMPGFRGYGARQRLHRAHGLHPRRIRRTPAAPYKLHFPGRQCDHRAALGARPDPAGGARVRRGGQSRPGQPRRAHRHGTHRLFAARYAGRAAQLRLNSTAIRVRHLGEPKSATEVEVTYLRAGRAYTAHARGSVLAGYNMMIPYLCPELPAAQKEALHSLVKTPLVYTSVALRNWRPFERLKLYRVYAPGSYHTYFHLNPTRRHRRVQKCRLAR